MTNPPDRYSPEPSPHPLMHRKTTTLVLTLALAALGGNPAQAEAQYGLTTISNPGPFYDTWAYGISGTNIVGCYASANDGHGSPQGFLYDGSRFITLTVPDALYFTEAFGSSGRNIVGSYGNNSGFYGFLYDGTNYLTLTVPGATYTQAYGISGDNIVGTSSLGSFLYDGSSYSILDFALTLPPVCRGICGNQIVGYYLAVTGYMQGLLATPVQAPPARASLTISAWAAGQWQIAVTKGAPGPDNATNVLQATTDLVHWTGISTNMGASQNFTNIVPATKVMTFYRVYTE